MGTSPDAAPSENEKNFQILHTGQSTPVTVGPDSREIPHHPD
jgi:hypothetical protein